MKQRKKYRNSRAVIVSKGVDSRTYLDTRMQLQRKKTQPRAPERDHFNWMKSERTRSRRSQMSEIDN
jgi:hypothetical protein